MYNRSYINAHKGHPHYFTDSKIISLQKQINLTGVEEEVLRIIKNLSDPTKLKIYLLLHKVKEIPVTDITHILSLTQSAVSHALTDLKNLGLVESHRCGQLICYSLTLSKKQQKFFGFFERLKTGGDK